MFTTLHSNQVAVGDRRIRQEQAPLEGYDLYASNAKAQVPAASSGRGAVRRVQPLWLLAVLLLSACGGGGGSESGGDTGSGPQLPSLESITLDPGSALIETNATQSVQVTAHLSDGGSTTSLTGVNWSSDDTSVAEVTAASGSTAEITGTGLGDATITATFAGEQASLDIGVTAALESLQVEPAVLELPEFDTEPLAARAIYSDGSSRDVTTLASWGVSRPAVATVDNDGDGAGTVEGVDADPDPVVVVAEYRGREASAEVTVIATPPDSVTVTPVTPTVHLGETLQLTAIAAYPDGVERDQTDDATWTSANDGIVTVDGGRLDPVSAGGPVTVTADVGGTTGTANVTVDPAVLEFLTVSPATLDLAEGSVYTDGYTLTATYNSVDEPVTADEVTWESDDSDIAFVSNATGSEGEIAAIEPGSTTVTASLGGVSAPVAVTVFSAPDGPGELNLSAQPDVILSDGSDSVTVLARVSPNDLEDGQSQEGLTVVYSIPDTGDPGSLSAVQALTDADGDASVTFTAGTSGTTAIHASLEVGLSQTVQVRTVDSFAQVFDTGLRTGDLDIVGGVIQAGSSFTLTLYNGSSREFDITNLSVTNGGGSIHDEPNPLGGTTGALRELPYTFTFDSSTPDNGITVTVDLREPSTGSTFSIVREVTTP